MLDPHPPGPAPALGHVPQPYLDEAPAPDRPPHPGAPDGPAGPAPSADGSRSTAAVLSLLLSVLCSPLGVVLAVIGLRETRGGRRRGRGLAVTALVVSPATALVQAYVLFVVVAVVTALPWSVGGFGRTSGATSPLAEPLESSAAAPAEPPDATGAPDTSANDVAAPSTAPGTTPAPAPSTASTDAVTMSACEDDAATGTVAVHLSAYNPSAVAVSYEVTFVLVDGSGTQHAERSVVIEDVAPHELRLHDATGPRDWPVAGCGLLETVLLDAG